MGLLGDVFWEMRGSGLFIGIVMDSVEWLFTKEYVAMSFGATKSAFEGLKH